MYCRRCCYEVTGLEAGPCPECGAAFDPDVPSSWDATPFTRQARARARRIGIVVVVVGLVVMGFYHTVLPRPLSLGQPFVLVWFGKSYGRELRNNPPARVYWFADRCRGVDLLNYGRVVGGEPADVPSNVTARLRRVGADHRWRLEVTRAGVSFSDLLLAINTYSESSEYFGIRILTGPRGRATTGAFTAAGDRAEVLSALLDNVGVTAVEPLLVENNDGRVWIWDSASSSLRRVTIDEAASLGYTDLAPARLHSFRRLASPTERRRW